MKIDRSVPIPIYYQLKQILLDEINRQVYMEGDCIPTEKELMAQYGVSRMTVRQAVSELATEGYLTRRKGMGTFVNQRKAKISTALDVNRIGKEEGREHPSRKLLDVRKEKASPHIAGILEIPEGSAVYSIRRVNYGSDQKPSIYSHIRLAGALVPDLRQHLDTITDGLHRFLDRKGYAITTIRQTIQVDHADQEVARVLDIPQGTPILTITNVGYTAQGLPVEYTVDSSRSTSIQITGTRTPTA